MEPCTHHVRHPAEPPANSLSAEADRLASANLASVYDGETKDSGDANVDPAQQSASDRMANYGQAADQVAPKMANNPEQVTREDAAHLQSREQRALGEETRGGIASQAKSMADQNAKKGNV